MYTRFLKPKPVANGESWFHVGAAVLVDTELATYEFVLESDKNEPETLPKSNDVAVPVIAEIFTPEGCVVCNGAAGVVKAPV